MAERFEGLGSQIDARRSDRTPSDFQMMLILRQEGKEIGETVRTINISQAGVRIRLKGALVPGQTIQLLPAEDSRSAYPCRVVWFKIPGPDRLSEAGLEFKTPWMTSHQGIINSLAGV